MKPHTEAAVPFEGRDANPSEDDDFAESQAIDTDDDLPVAVPGQPGPDKSAESELSERERQVLAFERQWWRHAGAKEQAIRDTFGLSATRYYQILNGLLDRPAALTADPVLVARLRRLRASRARQRRR